MGISAKELAKKIKVSPATISMVFNNKPGISEATRNLVFEAAKQYNYVPAKSQAPEKKNIQLIIYQKHALVVSDTPFFSQVIEGISHAGNDNGCIVGISYFSETQDRKTQIQNLKSLGADGFVLLATEMNREDFEIFRELKKTMVVLDSYYDDLDYDCIVINNNQGAFIATDYLIKLGYRKVGYLHSSVYISNFQERADGYFKALRANGLSTSHPFVHHISPTSAQGYQDMMNILKEKPSLAEAYFADNDIIASAAMKAFQANGYRVPEDISIIGFDDMPLCDMLNPPLSSMHVDTRQLGQMAVDALLSRMEGKRSGILKLAFGTSLICRESVREKNE